MESRGRRLVKLGVSLGVHLVDVVVGAAFKSRRRDRRSSGVVLMYHDVPPQKRLAFARQCDQLVGLAAPSPLDAMHGEPDGIWRVALTFDDAFRTFMTEALPELERREVPSTLFVPTQWLTRDSSPEVDKKTLTPDELAALPDTVEIASHSRTHVRLPELSAASLDRELAGSRQELEAITGREIRYHAFPYGAHDPRVNAAARAAGYERCYGVAPTMISPADGYVAGRVLIDPGDWPIEVRLKALGAYRWVAWWMRARARSLADTTSVIPFTSARAMSRRAPTEAAGDRGGSRAAR